MYIYIATGDTLEMIGGKKTGISQCIVDTKGGNIEERWEGGNVEDVIECPEKIKLLGNIHT